MSALSNAIRNKGPALCDPRNLRYALPFLRALAFAASVPLLLRMKLPRLDAWLERRFSTAGHGRVSTENRDIREILRPVNLAVGLLRHRCLGRGLTRYYFLRRAGFEVVLCFGVRLVGGGLTGHCWLEKAGVPFLEPGPAVRYSEPIYQMPSGIR